MELGERVQSLLNRISAVGELTLVDTRPLFPTDINPDFQPLPPIVPSDPAETLFLFQRREEWESACEEMCAATWLRERGLVAERRTLEFQIASKTDPFTNTLVVSCSFIGEETDCGASLRDELSEFAVRRGALPEWDRSVRRPFGLRDEVGTHAPQT